METEKEKMEKEQKQLIKEMTQNIMNNYKAASKIQVDRTYELKKIEKSK